MSSSVFINEHNGQFTVEPAHSSTPLFTGRTQDEAIRWAKANLPNYAVHVARVRHLSDKRIPDHWRRV
jgi:hypothetical protein